MFFFKRNKQLLDRLSEFLDTISESLLIFEEAIKYYLEHGYDDQFEVLVRKVDKMESHADDQRRGLEMDLYANHLIPESRGDILGLIESTDKVCNKAEHILAILSYMNLKIPDFLTQDVEMITQLSLETFNLVRLSIENLFKDGARILELTQKIDRNESLCDTIEHRSYKRIFSAKGLDKSDMILLRDFISQMGSVTDICEDIADRVTLSNIKRKI